MKLDSKHYKPRERERRRDRKIERKVKPYGVRLGILRGSLVKEE